MAMKATFKAIDQRSQALKTYTAVRSAKVVRTLKSGAQVEEIQSIPLNATELTALKADPNLTKYGSFGKVLSSWFAKGVEITAEGVIRRRLDTDTYKGYLQNKVHLFRVTEDKGHQIVTKLVVQLEKITGDWEVKPVKDNDSAVVQPQQ